MAELQHKTTESAEQAALIRWAMFMENRYPELELLYHVPNGGKRDRITATKLKAEGVKAGVPDLVLPVRRGGYLGLYIEMKVGRNTPSANQEYWLKKLAEQGYKTAVCYGWEEASAVLENYLKQVPTLDMINDWMEGIK